MITFILSTLLVVIIVIAAAFSTQRRGRARDVVAVDKALLEAAEVVDRRHRHVHGTSHPGLAHLKLIIGNGKQL